MNSHISRELNFLYLHGIRISKILAEPFQKSHINRIRITPMCISSGLSVIPTYVYVVPDITLFSD